MFDSELHFRSCCGIFLVDVDMFVCYFFHVIPRYLVWTGSFRFAAVLPATKVPILLVLLCSDFWGFAQLRRFPHHQLKTRDYQIPKYYYESLINANTEEIPGSIAVVMTPIQLHNYFRMRIAFTVSIMASIDA